MSSIDNNVLINEKSDTDDFQVNTLVSANHERETEMMSVRWRVFEFSRKIPQEEQKDLPPCPRCFSELVFLDEQFYLFS